MDLEPLCPLGDRRTARELLVKLVIAHVTAVAAFCNHVSLRNQDLASIEPLLFLLCPLIVPLQISMGLLLITGVFLANVVTSRSSVGHEFWTFTRRLRALLGRKPNNSSNSSLARSSTGSLESGGAGQVAGSRLGRAYVTMGRLLLVLGTLFQCVATIFLCARRVEDKGWESLSVVDFRTFELAVGGAAVSVLSAALLLNVPGFGRMEQDIPGGHVDAALPLFVGDPQRSRRWWFLAYSEKHGIWTCIIPVYALCHLACTSNGTPVVAQRSHWVLPEIFLGECLYLSQFVYVPGILGVILVCSTWIKDRVGGTKLSRSDLLSFLLYPPGIYLGFVLLMPAYMLLALVVIWSPFEVLLYKGSEAYDLWSQMEYAASTDETHACPTLWKDPLSEYLWSLV